MINEIYCQIFKSMGIEYHRLPIHQLTFHHSYLSDSSSIQYCDVPCINNQAQMISQLFDFDSGSPDFGGVWVQWWCRSGSRVPFWGHTQRDTHTTPREYHRFWNPPGSQVRDPGVQVWVAKFVPSQNPYPQQTGMGFHGFFPRVFEIKNKKNILT